MGNQVTTAQMTVVSIRHGDKAAIEDFAGKPMGFDGDRRPVFSEGGIVCEDHKFTVEHGMDGKVAFRSSDGFYLSADSSVGFIVNREEAGEWEYFSIIHHDDGKVSIVAWNGWRLKSGPHNIEEAILETVAEEEKFSIHHFPSEVGVDYME